MKKLAEKIAIVAQICITMVFVLICILYLFGFVTINVEEGVIQTDAFVLVLVAVLAVIYAALSAFILYMNFSERQSLKYVLLHSDSESSTRATYKVIKKVADDTGSLVDGVKIRKVQIRSDEKLGFKMKVFVDVNSDDVALTIDKLRCLLADSFSNILGLKFSLIDFQLCKMSTSYTPDVDKAAKQAQILNADRKYAKNCYDEPLTVPSESEIKVVSQEETEPDEEKDETDDNEKEESAPKAVYGEPESPLSDDIVVEINDGEEEKTDN